MRVETKTARILYLLAIIFLIFAGPNLLAYVLWPSRDAPPPWENAGEIPAAASVLRLESGPDASLPGFRLSIPMLVEDYRLVSAYPEELSLLYRSAEGATLLFQVSDEPVNKRLAFIADFPLSALLASSRGPRFLAWAASMPDKFAWTWNPARALFSRLLIKAKRFAAAGSSQTMPYMMDARVHGAGGEVWRAFAAPEMPYRFYGVTKFQGGWAVDIHIAFRGLPNQPESVVAALAGLVHPLDAKESATRVALRPCEEKDDASPICQALLVADMLRAPQDMTASKKLLSLYMKLGDARGAVALLDFYRDRRLLDREAREFCESVEAAFPLLE